MGIENIDIKMFPLTKSQIPEYQADIIEQLDSELDFKISAGALGCGSALYVLSQNPTMCRRNFLKYSAILSTVFLHTGEVEASLFRRAVLSVIAGRVIRRGITGILGAGALGFAAVFALDVIEEMSHQNSYNSYDSGTSYYKPSTIYSEPYKLVNWTQGGEGCCKISIINPTEQEQIGILDIMLRNAKNKKVEMQNKFHLVANAHSKCDLEYLFRELPNTGEKEIYVSTGINSTISNKIIVENCV